MSADNQPRCVLSAWWGSRLPLSEASFSTLAGKKVPLHRLSWAYFIGGLILIAFCIQIISGALLLLYYQPTVVGANESIQFISRTVPGGLFIRSLHAWTASAMVLLIFLHAFSTALMRAYRRPRELTWVTGALLFLLVMGLAFSGYLLPWSTLSVYATKIGLQIMHTSTHWLPGALSSMGPAAAGLLAGSGDVGQATLSRFFALHVVILPLLLVSLVPLHLLLVQIHGLSVPPSLLKKQIKIAPAAGPEQDQNDLWHGQAEKFFPPVLLKDMAVWLLFFGCICILAEVLPYDYFLPYTLARPYDALAAAPSGIKPEWYFLAMYYLLEIFPRDLVIISSLLLLLCFLGLPWVMSWIPRWWKSSIEQSLFPTWSVILVGGTIIMLTIFGAQLIRLTQGVAP